MKVTFYGVRGSIPCPGPKTSRYGGNTSCVEIQIPDSNQIFIIDAGTGIRDLGSKLATRRDIVINLFISHTHWDHIHGFPFFVPIYMPHHKLNVFGPSHDIVDLSLGEVLTKQMEYSVFPVRFADLQASITYSAMKREERIIEDVRVEARPLNHPVLTLGYRITHQGKTVVYQSDHEPFYNLFQDEDEENNRFIADLNREIADFAKDADLLIADSMYTPEEYETHRGWGHSSTMHVLERAIEAKVKKVAIFHHDPSHSDDFMDKVLVDLNGEVEKRGVPLEVIIATEGASVEL